MTNPIEFRLKVLAHASTAYAVAHPTQPTATSVGLASQLAEACVQEANRLGLFGQIDVPQSAVAQPTQPIMPPPLQGFPQGDQQQQQLAAQQAAQEASMAQAQFAVSGGGGGGQAPVMQSAMQGASGAPIAAAPIAQATQVPMAPLQQGGAPQMTIHPSSTPVPQMPISAAMAAAVPQVPMQPQPGGNPVPQTMNAQPAPMQMPMVQPSFQPLGPNGPTIPLPMQAYVPPTQQQPAQAGAQPVQSGGFQPPPPPMGGTNKVVQAPMPQNFSALGTIGVQEKVEQRPMAQDTIVTPGNQSVVQGGGIAEVVTEKITH